MAGLTEIGLGRFLILATEDVRWELWVRGRPRIVQVSTADVRVTGSYWCYQTFGAARKAAEALDGTNTPDGWVLQSGKPLTPSPE